MGWKDRIASAFGYGNNPEEPPLFAVIIVNGIRLLVVASNDRETRDAAANFGLPESEIFGDKVLIQPLDGKYWDHIKDYDASMQRATASEEEFDEARELIGRLGDYVNTGECREFTSECSMQAGLMFDFTLLNDRSDSAAADARMHKHVFDKLVRNLYRFKKEEETGLADAAAEKLDVAVCEEFYKAEQKLRTKSLFFYEQKQPFYVLRDKSIERFKKIFLKPSSHTERAEALESFRNECVGVFASMDHPDKNNICDQLIHDVMQRVLRGNNPGNPPKS